MFKYLVGLVLFSSTLLMADLTEDRAVKNVYGHLLLNDRRSAVNEAKRALSKYPDSKTLKLSLIRALCEKGDETEAWEQWQKLQDEHSNRYLIETLAWECSTRENPPRKLRFG